MLIRTHDMYLKFSVNYYNSATSTVNLKNNNQHVVGVWGGVLVVDITWHQLPLSQGEQGAMNNVCICGVTTKYAGGGQGQGKCDFARGLWRNRCQLQQGWQWQSATENNNFSAGRWWGRHHPPFSNIDSDDAEVYNNSTELLAEDNTTIK